MRNRKISLVIVLVLSLVALFFFYPLNLEKTGLGSGVFCGNGNCNPFWGEDCSTCPEDCGCDNGEYCQNGECVSSCGNGDCDYGETCFSCPEDCSPCCGDQTCDPDETCTTCSIDCPQCCGDGDCSASECCTTCSQDCGSCTSTCGNCICESSWPSGCETESNCPVDCDDCNYDGICDTCEDSGCADCQTNCGDEVCEGTEDNPGSPYYCPEDCGCDYDGECESDRGESCYSCPEDCCPPDCDNDGTCESAEGENCQNCEDCSCGDGSCCFGSSGTTCCDSTESCYTIGTNGVCCSNEVEFCVDECCEFGEECCNDDCCTVGQECCNDQCVPEGTCDPCEDCEPCGGSECSPGQVCLVQEGTGHEVCCDQGDGLCGNLCYNPNSKQCCSDSSTFYTCDIGQFCDAGSCSNNGESCGTDGCETELGENCDSCPADCGCPEGEECIDEACVPETPGYCGDGICNSTEHCANCYADCPCDPGEECSSSGTCSISCGNNVCETDETCSSCPEDCSCSGYCGDGTCQTQDGEDCNTCPLDCGECPEPDENDTQPPEQLAWDPPTGSSVESGFDLTISLDEQGLCRWCEKDFGYDNCDNECNQDFSETIVCSISGLSEGLANIFTSCMDVNLNEDTGQTNTKLSFSVMKEVTEEDGEDSAANDSDVPDNSTPGNQSEQPPPPEEPAEEPEDSPDEYVKEEYENEREDSEEEEEGEADGLFGLGGALTRPVLDTLDNVFGPIPEQVKQGVVPVMFSLFLFAVVIGAILLLYLPYKSRETAFSLLSRKEKKEEEAKVKRFEERRELLKNKINDLRKKEHVGLSKRDLTRKKAYEEELYQIEDELLSEDKYLDELDARADKTVLQAKEGMPSKEILQQLKEEGYSKKEIEIIRRLFKDRMKDT